MQGVQKSEKEAARLRQAASSGTIRPLEQRDSSRLAPVSPNVASKPEDTLLTMEQEKSEVHAG